MLATKLLRINSKYRTPNSASCADFSVNIDSRDCENISQCVLLSATIPRMFGNVYAPNNELNCVYGTAPNPQQTLTFQINPGLYTAATLAAEIDRVVNAEFSFIRVRFDEVRQRIHFVTTDPPADFALDVIADSGLAAIAGISSTLITTFQPDAFAQSPPALQGPTQLYIESQFIGNRACLDILENGASIPLFNVIPCALVPSGFDITYQATNVDGWAIDYDVESTGLANLRTVDIRITDTYGYVLPIPANQHSDFVFKLYRRV